MTLDEAKEICRKLTQLNLAIWGSSSSNETERLRAEFRQEIKKVYDGGFKIRRWRNGETPMFTPRVEKHADIVCMSTNKPDNLDIKRDCTTRALSFCTGLDYCLIRDEQLKNALDTNLTWRHTAVWEKSLLSRGFTKIFLTNRYVSRATFIRLSKTLPVNEGKIATVSSGHVAAIDMATRKVLDTWNSTGGRIKYIYVPLSQREVYLDWLRKVGCCL